MSPDRPRRAEPAAAHHRDPIADAEQLRQVAADQQHRASCRRARRPARRSAGRSAPCCRRRCRASARRAGARPRRDAAAARPPPSAGCRPTVRRRSGAGRAHGSPAGRSSAPPRVLARRADGERRTERLEPRQRHVVGDAQCQREPLALAVLADHPDALPPAPRGAAAPAYDADARPRPLRTGSSPKMRAQQLRAPGADEPGDAEHFAAVQRQRSRSLAPSAVELEHRLAGRRGEPRVELARPSARPSSRRSARRRVRGRAAADALAVAQHGEAVGDRLHFFEEVRDVDDRDAPAP